VVVNFVIFHQIKVAKHIWHPCCRLVSISPTLYEQLLRQNPFAKKLQTQIASKEKLRKKRSYKKAAHKILVKLTPSDIIGQQILC
jgi:hypothetical protein